MDCIHCKRGSVFVVHRGGKIIGVYTNEDAAQQRITYECASWPKKRKPEWSFAGVHEKAHVDH
uniref:Uncharacterized protein n=1 Tax=viral metagenome TaxID=1070528 RepID=A0A6M3JEL8_9ZZZZ